MVLLTMKKPLKSKKADAWASRIDQRRHHFTIGALKNADPSCSVGTVDASIDIDRNESEGIYGGDYDIGDNGNLSYHSSNGSDEDDFDVDLSLGDGVEGTSPPANARNTARKSLLGGRLMTYRTGSIK